ncbi:unnamed protein product, partial [Brassica oleracea]
QEEEETKEQELTLEEIYRLRADGSRPAVPLKPSFSKKTGRADKNITFSKVKKPARGNKNKWFVILVLTHWLETLTLKGLGSDHRYLRAI